ncbi:SIS domain-containing protein [Erysipelothrix rhusiopathiae]|nr:SIS domain-containing protein [Erysipelothrix rhusiopathiae]
MLKFDKEKQLASFKGGLALRPEIEKVADAIHDKGYNGIYFVGIGGTYASALQVAHHVKEMSTLPIYVEHAAEYLVTGNKNITKDSIIVYSSVTGTTQEVVAAVKVLKEVGCTIVAFVDEPNSILAELGDYTISYGLNEQLKFFMFMDRLMQRKGDFDDYEAMYQEFDQYLPEALVDVEIKADAFGEAYAKRHHDDAMHYFVGAGNQWGATYSYAMCYWEEQHWLPTKSITAPEFFHGMFEIVERDTPVTIFVGEDTSRPLSTRVVDFIPRICANYEVIDSKDYELKGISEKYRGHICHLVMMAVNRRIDAHIEKINCHPTEIHRYYRQLDY